jgi:DNA polymerase-3 subunit delta'
LTSHPALHPLRGHEAERGIFARARREGTLPAAMLLHGARGVGKQRLALWTAQLALCEAAGDEPCGQCQSCRLALGLQHPDIHWHFPLARPKGASGDKLGDALEQARGDELVRRREESVSFTAVEEATGIYLAAVQTIRRRAYTLPAMSKEQVFVIGDAEAMVSQEASQEAANAVLKLLEEPPTATRFILTSSEPGRLLPTVRSRMVPIHVGRLPVDEVQRFLQQQVEVPTEAAARAARLGAGSIGRSLGFLPTEDGPGPLEKLRQRALEVVAAALSRRRDRGYVLALSFPPANARALTELLDFVDEALRDLAALAAGAEQHTVYPDAAAQLAGPLREVTIDPTDAARTLAVVERYREMARGNVNPHLLIAGLVEDLRRVLVRPALAGGRP